MILSNKIIHHLEPIIIWCDVVHRGFRYVTMCLYTVNPIQLGSMFWCLVEAKSAYWCTLHDQYVHSISWYPIFLLFHPLCTLTIRENLTQYLQVNGASWISWYSSGTLKVADHVLSRHHWEWWMHFSSTLAPMQINWIWVHPDYCPADLH